MSECENGRIFISYRRDTGGWLSMLLAQMLTSHGFEVFRDLETLGGRWQERLKQTIATCDHFLLVLTKGCLDRCSTPDDVLTREIATAHEAGKPIVLLEDEYACIDYDRLPESISFIKQLHRHRVAPEPKGLDRAMTALINKELKWPSDSTPWRDEGGARTLSCLIISERGGKLYVRVDARAVRRKEVLAYLNRVHSEQRYADGVWCFAQDSFYEEIQPAIARCFA